MICYEEKIRVRYKETDKMGIVHHSNYIVYYEAARVAALRAWDLSYDEMEKSGIISPILEIGSKYIQPAYFDDLLTVKVIVDEVPMVRFKVRYEMYNEAGTLINTGHTWLGFLNAETRRPCRAPQYLVDKMQELMDKSEKIYQIGDYYDDGKKQGVVFEVSEDGRHGKILSLTETHESWSPTKEVGDRTVGMFDESDGANNMSVITKIDDWREQSPAVAWCADLGEGWYLPAIEELKSFLLVKDVFDAVNKTLSDKGEVLRSGKGYYTYVSSTESKVKPHWMCWDTHVFVVNMGELIIKTNGKNTVNFVRAVSAF
ncbi:MAG: acyl-CoA thioesterase [Alistipes sp.]|nr:acyl-CoA thioesterase [Alistipes sp.]